MTHLHKKSNTCKLPRADSRSHGWVKLQPCRDHDARGIYNQAYEHQSHNVLILQHNLSSISTMSLSMLPSVVPTGAVGFRHSFRVFTPLLMSAARRRMATGAPVNNLSSKGTKEPLHKGVEGPHISACFTARQSNGRVLMVLKGTWCLLRPRRPSTSTGTGCCFTRSTPPKS